MNGMRGRKYIKQYKQYCRQTNKEAIQASEQWHNNTEGMIKETAKQWRETHK